MNTPSKFMQTVPAGELPESAVSFLSVFVHTKARTKFIPDMKDKRIRPINILLFLTLAPLLSPSFLPLPLLSSLPPLNTGLSSNSRKVYLVDRKPWVTYLCSGASNWGGGSFTEQASGSFELKADETREWLDRLDGVDINGGLPKK